MTRRKPELVSVRVIPWEEQQGLYGLVYEFDDELTSRSRIDPARRPRPFHLYQRKLTLHPGRYKLELVVRETATKKLGTAESLVLVTRPSAELQAQLILANGVTPAGPGETVADPFVVGDDLKVYPSPDKMFAAQGKLGVYLELYHLGQDPAAHASKIQFGYRVSRDGVAVPGLEKQLAPTTIENAGTVNAFFALPLASLTPGRYALEVDVGDLIAGKTLRLKDTFQLR